MKENKELKNSPSLETPENSPPFPLEFPTVRPLRIAIVGAGSIGLYYGAKLTEANCEVSFLMRSGFEQAQASGIQIYSPLGNKTLQNPKIFLRAEDIGPVDCVFVSLKTTSNV